MNFDYNQGDALNFGVPHTVQSNEAVFNMPGDGGYVGTDFAMTVRDASTDKKSRINGAGVAVTELVASFFFYYAMAIATMASLSPIGFSITQGAAVFVVGAVFWRFGAGYVDPFFTIALAVAGQVPGPWWTIVIYLLAQTAGAVLAPLVVWWTLGTSLLGLGAPTIVTGVSVQTVFLFELFATFAIVFVRLMLAFAASESAANRKSTDKPIWIETIETSTFAGVFGIAYVMFSAAGVTISGASFNWYRHFWPALFSGTLGTTWWLYLVPDVIAVFAGIVIVLSVMWWRGSYTPTIKGD